MPVHEYECQDCGAVTPVAHASGQGGRIAARVCAACGGRNLRRVMSAFAYHREVTLEDLGIKAPPPAPQGPGAAPAPEQAPPPGGCPYCNSGNISDDTP